ncbi:MAG TPA: ribonuclease HI family protein [Janthinobacterium sp.]|jgi:ribonuclease HI|nr:ribonuclease HI family protein [Janthinobacterium sp.]
MTEADELAALAYKSERASGRRLAQSAGISEQQALRLTLESAAGAAGLEAMLAGRRHDRLADAERRAGKAQARAAKLASRRTTPAPPRDAWLAWFDGSALPNPGRIGIGALLTGPAGERVEISRRAGHGNSGEAEYLALIALMEAALPARPAELLVFGDSRVVIDDVNQMQAKGAAGLAAYRTRARELMGQLGKVTLRWIPRHKNAAADALSQQARIAYDGQ